MDQTSLRSHLMADQPSADLRRVLIGLGASADDEAIIDVAAFLAGAIGAQLAAVYVEDTNLLDLAELPFTRIVSATNRPPPELTVANMEAAFQRQAYASRRSVSVHAERVRARWTFSTVRGTADQEIKSAASSGDIVVVQSPPHAAAGSNFIARARSAAAEAGGVVVPPRRRAVLQGPVVVIDDGDATGAKSVATGRAIALARNEPLEVLIVPRDSEEDVTAISRAQKMTEDVRDRQVRLLESDATGDIALELRRIGPSFIVGDLQGRPFLSDDDAQALINAAECPALLLGG